MVYWFISVLGYETTVHLKDFILFCAGISLGLCAMALIAGEFFYKLDRVDHLKKMTVVKLVHEGEHHYLSNPRNYWEAVEAIINLSVMVIFKKKKYTLEDKKRTKKFIMAFLIFLVACVVLASFFLVQIVLPA